MTTNSAQVETKKDSSQRFKINSKANLGLRLSIITTAKDCISVVLSHTFVVVFLFPSINHKTVSIMISSEAAMLNQCTYLGTTKLMLKSKFYAFASSTFTVSQFSFI